MGWTGDKELADRVEQLRNDYGYAALAVAVDDLMRVERDLELERRKVAHGCTDALCETCD